MSKKDFDIVYCILNFDLPTKSGQKFMNRNSFYDNVYNSEKFRESLSKDQIMGLLTHKGRFYEKIDTNIPYPDNIILNKWWANIAKDIDIQGSEVLAYLKLVNREGGEAVKNILQEGTPLGVSMSTYCNPNYTNEYYITELLGIDHTMDPAFLGTRLVTKNFSEPSYKPTEILVNCSNHYNNKSLDIVNFSSGYIVENHLNIGNLYNIPIDINKDGNDKEIFLSDKIENYFSSVNEFDNYFINKSKLKTFTPSFEVIREEASKSIVNFSLLKQMMIEASYPPHRQLSKRIEELIRDIQNKPPEYIEKNKQIYFQFINTPIYDWISRAFNLDKKIMLSIGLRLGRYIKRPGLVQEADRKLENIKKKRKLAGGIFDRQSQKNLDNVLKELFDELWKYIETKSNVTIVSENSKQTILRTFNDKGVIMNFKTVEDWLDAGSNGQKDYEVWIKNFPYSAKDLPDFLKSKEYYNYPDVDKYIDLLANKKLPDSEKKKLVEIMKNVSLNTFSAHTKNFDNESTIQDNAPQTPEESESGITQRTLTNEDINNIVDKMLSDPNSFEILANKVYEKVQQEGGFPTPINNEGNNGNPPDTQNNDTNDPNQMNSNNDIPQDQPMDNQQQNSNTVPQDQNQNIEEMPTPPNQGDIKNAINNSPYPKPATISKQQASQLMGFSRVINALNYNNVIENFSMSNKKRFLAFSVIELIDPKLVDENNLELLNFCLLQPYGVNKVDAIQDVLTVKHQYENGVINFSEYSEIKNRILDSILE